MLKENRLPDQANSEGPGTSIPATETVPGWDELTGEQENVVLKIMEVGAIPSLRWLLVLLELAAKSRPSIFPHACRHRSRRASVT